MATSPPAPEQQTFDAAKMYVWLKALESKINNLVREVEVIKNDLVQKQNQIKKEVKTISNDLLELKHVQEQFVQRMDLIIKELKQTAGIEEVMTLRKYIDLWNPLAFVTQRDLERAIDARLALSKKKESPGVDDGVDPMKKNI